MSAGVKTNRKTEIETGEQKPVALSPVFVGIPLELASSTQCVVWDYEKGKTGKWTKTPISVKTGKHASSTNRATWATFEEARQRYERGGVAGVGVVISGDDDFTGIDLDSCIDEAGCIAEWANGIVDRFNSYAELSPSGTGVKIWVRGNVREFFADNKGGAKRGNIEVYSAGRFFTVTGRRIGDASAITGDQQENLRWLVETYLSEKPKEQPGRKPDTLPRGLPDYRLWEVINRSVSADKINRLMDGITTDYGDDHSRADAALVSYLAFFIGPDRSRIEAEFNRSKLAERGKWKDRPDYRARTIDKVLSSKTDYYSSQTPLTCKPPEPTVSQDADDLPAQDKSHGSEMEKRALVGYILGDKSARQKIREHLRAFSFTAPHYQIIAKTAFEMVDRGKDLDALLLANEIDKHGHTEQAGGSNVIDELIAACPDVANAATYAKEIAERHEASAIAELSDNIARGLLDRSMSPYEASARLTERLSSIRARSSAFPSATADDDLPGEDEISWAWESFLAYGYVTLLAAMWKAGKTSLLACLCRELMNGGLMFDRQVSQGKVLVFTEEPRGRWRRRRDAFGFAKKTAYFISLCDFHCTPTPESWLALLEHAEREAERLGCKIIVLDVLQMFWGVLDENDSAKVQVAMTPLKALANRGYAILLTCHTSKADGGKSKLARGSGALPGSVDNIMEIRRQDQNDMANPFRELTVIGRLEDEPMEITVEYDLIAKAYSVSGTTPEVKASNVNDAIAAILPTSTSDALDADALSKKIKALKDNGEWKGKSISTRTLQKILPNELLLGKPRWQRCGLGQAHSPFRYYRAA